MSNDIKLPTRGYFKRSDKSPEMIKIQTALKSQGFWNDVPFNENFGPASDASVKKFQAAKGLKADGLVGKDTLRLLGLQLASSSSSPSPVESATSSPAPSKSSGTESGLGEAVDKLLDFVKLKEGGHSNAKTDTASSDPSPYVRNGETGWHTNRGITWTTFKSLSSSLGYEINEANFMEMPDTIWAKIALNGYWSPYNLKTIKHLPRIQAVIFTWAWGSGLGGSEIRLARFQRDTMGIVDGNITKLEITENFNKLITSANEKEYFDKLCDRRLADFKKMSTWDVNGKGWSNRLTAFRKLFAEV